MKTVLITGVNGFIGKALCSFYINNGDRVIGISRNKNPDLNCTHYCVDLLEDSLDEILIKHKPDYILHCAGSANVSLSIRNPELDFNLNVSILYNLLNAMKRVSIKAKLIFFSSAGVYGQPEKLPIAENSPLNPISPYAMHKVLCEQICNYFINVHDFDIRIIRIFSAFGPGLRKQLFWDMACKLKEDGYLSLFGTGDESRDFIYIDDLVNAVDCILNYTGQEKIFNVANGQEHSIKSVANIFLKVWDPNTDEIVQFSSVKRIGDPNNWRADISLLRKTGYSQKVGIEEGIEAFVRWIKSLGA